MKSILNIKNRIIRLGVVFVGVISFGIFMQNCSNEDEYIDSTRDSKLESLISSSEYKILNKNLETFGKDLKSNYLKLSNIDKEKVIDILNNIKTSSSSQEELGKLFEEFNSLTKTDFKATVNKIYENNIELNLYREKNNISNKEFAFAVNKYPNNNIPRLKVGFENDGTTECIIACSAVTTVCMVTCIGPQAAVGCHALCLVFYAACCILC
jgi:hypothetical protein